MQARITQLACHTAASEEPDGLSATFNHTFLFLRFIRISRCNCSVMGWYRDSQAVFRGVSLCCGTVICAKYRRQVGAALVTRYEDHGLIIVLAS